MKMIFGRNMIKIMLLTHQINNLLMKHFFFRYLNGLNNISKKSVDTDVYIVLTVVFYVILIINLIDGMIDFKIWIPSEFFGNKLIGKLFMGGLLYAFCYYVLGIKESNYTKYEPLGKGVSVAIFLLSFLFLGFLIYVTKK